jgi:hypothetical protein
LSRLHALDFFSVVTFLFCWWCWDWTRVLEHVLYHWATSRPMVFGDRLLLCSPGWPQVLDPPASAFWVLWVTFLFSQSFLILPTIFALLFHVWRTLKAF